MVRRIQLAVGVVAGLALVAPASAQTPQGGATTVPSDVLTLLLEGPDGLAGQRFDLRVGLAPLDFPRDLLPPGAAVRVSAVAADATTVVASTGQFSADDRTSFEQRLEASGWINPLRPRGFAGRNTGPTLSLCQADRFATLSFFPEARGGTYIRATLRREPGRACMTQPSITRVDVPLPSLTLPAGARPGRAAMGGSPGAVYSSIRLDTSQDVGRISSHYAAQLTAAGWTIEGRSAADSAMSVTRLRALGSGGDPATGLLIVTAIEGTSQVDVMLRVVTQQVARPAAGVR